MTWWMGAREWLAWSLTKLWQITNLSRGIKRLNWNSNGIYCFLAKKKILFLSSDDLLFYSSFEFSEFRKTTGQNVQNKQ